MFNYFVSPYNASIFTLLYILCLLENLLPITYRVNIRDSLFWEKGGTKRIKKEEDAGEKPSSHRKMC